MTDDRTVPVYYDRPRPEDERQYLQDLVKDLESELEGVRNRIKELEKETKK